MIADRAHRKRRYEQAEDDNDPHNDNIAKSHTTSSGGNGHTTKGFHGATLPADSSLAEGDSMAIRGVLAAVLSSIGLVTGSAGPAGAASDVVPGEVSDAVRWG